MHSNNGYQESTPSSVRSNPVRRPVVGGTPAALIYRGHFAAPVNSSSHSIGPSLNGSSSQVEEDESVCSSSGGSSAGAAEDCRRRQGRALTAQVLPPPPPRIGGGNHQHHYNDDNEDGCGDEDQSPPSEFSPLMLAGDPTTTVRIEGEMPYGRGSHHVTVSGGGRPRLGRRFTFVT